jgi:hypothetical protein
VVAVGPLPQLSEVGRVARPQAIGLRLQRQHGSRARRCQQLARRAFADGGTSSAVPCPHPRSGGERSAVRVASRDGVVQLPLVLRRERGRPRPTDASTVGSFGRGCTRTTGSTPAMVQASRRFSSAAPQDSRAPRPPASMTERFGRGRSAARRCRAARVRVARAGCCGSTGRGSRTRPAARTWRRRSGRRRVTGGGWCVVPMTAPRVDRLGAWRATALLSTLLRTAACGECAWSRREGPKVLPGGDAWPYAPATCRGCHGGTTSLRPRSTP